ncbi:MAG: amidohydrolase [Chloroflexi bacterium]|nr:amidohydrolase [Chloroflexota bacterium]
MIVDTHVHIWEMPPIAPIGPTAPNWKSLPDEPATAEELLKDMDANAVDAAVLVQTSWSTWDNGYVADSARRHPHRLVAMGLVDPLDEKNSETVSYWMRERGMAGFRFHPMYYPDEDVLTARRNRKMWKTLADSGAVVQVHMGPQQAKQVDAIAAEYREMPILLDHMSYPDVAGSPEYAAYRPVLHLARHSNVYVKVSDASHRSKQPFPFRDVHDVIRRIRDAFGADRLLWGTGYPGRHREKHGWLSLADELKLVREGFDFLDDVEKSKLLGDNAARIWKFTALLSS